MSKPKVYDNVIPTTNSSVMDGQGNAKNSGKAKARYPHPPLGIGQNNGEQGKMKRPALTPGTSPSGS